MKKIYLITILILCFMFSNGTSGKNIVSIHPLTLLMSPFSNQGRTFLLDYERVVSNRLSVLVSGGPSFMNSEVEVDDFVLNVEGVNIYFFAGVKHYFGDKQKGLYLSERIGVFHTDISLVAKDNADLFSEADTFEDSGLIFAGLLYVGYQWAWSKVTLNLDGGLGYQRLPYKVELDVPDDYEFMITMMNLPIAIDANLSLGYRF
ncbi:MAG: hypothetical protein HQK83_13650 [Fibrobacteria bacterium]|nr:hypothetical protein [Fibrobacteria bacterium]